MRKEVIKVHGGSDVDMVVRETIFGPIISDSVYPELGSDSKLPPLAFLWLSTAMEKVKHLDTENRGITISYSFVVQLVEAFDCDDGLYFVSQVTDRLRSSTCSSGCVVANR